MRFHATLPPLAIALLASLLGAAGGCTQARTFTIYAKPADARLIIDGVQHGPGPITKRFEFTGHNDLHHVRAVAPGYEARGEDLWLDTPQNSIFIQLRPLPRRVVFTVGPVPGVVKVNGRPLTQGPADKAEYTLDATNPATEYVVTAEAPGYRPAELTLRGGDRPGYYALIMRPAAGGPSDDAVAMHPGESMRSVDPDRGGTSRTERPADPPPDNPPPVVPPPAADAGREEPVPDRPEPRPQPPTAFTRDIKIDTDPPKIGATIYLNGEEWGRNGLELPRHEFKRGPDGKPLPLKVTATAPGFEGGDETIQWEDQRSEYVVSLGRRKKNVRVVTDPAGAVVTLDDKPLPRDRTGAAAATILFPPTDPPEGPATYTARVAATSDAWEPQELKIGWDEGQQEYRVKLAPARSAKATLLRPALLWRPEGGWYAEARRVETVGIREPGEGPGRPAATRFAGVPAGTVPDAIAVSPDGSRLVCTVLSATAEGALRSSLRLFNTDGTPGGTLPGEDRSLDLTPAFTPDGARILFASDRGGAGGVNVWSMPLAAERGAAAGVKQVSSSANATLWPSEDSNPQPRLFYEAVLKGPAGNEAEGSEVRVYDAAPRTFMTLSRGTHPRPSPRADSVMFTLADPATGNRDLYLVSDHEGVPLGGQPVNLTNTPDVDECDPVWSRNGARVAFAANSAADETGRRNYDVFVMNMTGRDRKQTRVTYNGSWDDGPAWDPTGRAIYFRSNRGGQWGVWKIAVP